MGLVYARGGHRVRLWDSQPAQVGQALAFAREVAPGLAQAGLLRGRTVDQLLAALEPVGRMEDALRDADYVQESTPERLDSKRRVYAELDRLAPAGAILASSTSALLPSHFTADLPGRARCLVAHPINPPYLVRPWKSCRRPGPTPPASSARAACWPRPASSPS